MAQGGGIDPNRSDAPPTLATALDGLKQRGSALLIVGSVPADVYRRVSSRMLGDGDAAPRRRLLVTGASEGERDSRLDAVERRTPEWTRIVEFDALKRGAAAATGETTTPTTSTLSTPTPGRSLDDETRGDPLRERVDGCVVELGTTVSETISQFEAITNGLSPAELRVAFDCLPLLLAEYDLETAFRFTHILANHVRSVHGMSHFWLPRERGTESVRVLEPLFDATVELRLDGTHLQQRWHFRDTDLSSDWLAFGSCQSERRECE